MLFYFFFFFNDTATTEIYTLSLHDALPICAVAPERRPNPMSPVADDYVAFLASKTARQPATGRACQADEVHPMLHGWQREITAWAVRIGRAALWEDTGLGKTL